MTYKWNNAGFKGNADKVGKELEKIESIEELTNVNVLEYAKKNKRSELHKCFEWNNDVAGERYRLIQATKLLTSISIVTKEEEPKETIRAYVNIRNTEEKRIFKNIVSIIEDDSQYTQLKDQAEKEFISYREKYEKILRLKDLKKIILDNL